MFARFQKSLIAGVVDAVIPPQTIGQRLAADIAGTDEGGAVKLSIPEVREQVGFHVKTLFVRFEYLDPGTLGLQQDQQTQGLGVGDVEVITGQDTKPNRIVRRCPVHRFLKIRHQQPQTAGFDEGDSHVDFIGMRNGM